MPMPLGATVRVGLESIRDNRSRLIHGLSNGDEMTPPMV